MNQRRILVAYDGTDDAYRALMNAADAALAGGAAIGVVTVSRGSAVADDAARILRNERLEAEMHTPVGDPATEIARVAHEHAYDAIYVGRRERESLERTLKRRVSTGVVRPSSRIAVLAR
jgi:nucleotide-binding universal stress UspA family protein